MTAGTCQVREADGKGKAPKLGAASSKGGGGGASVKLARGADGKYSAQVTAPAFSGSAPTAASVDGGRAGSRPGTASRSRLTHDLGALY